MIDFFVELFVKEQKKVIMNIAFVTCLVFICFLYFVYLVSVDPDIGDIDGK